MIFRIKTPVDNMHQKEALSAMLTARLRHHLLLAAALGAFLLPAPAAATVTTSTRTVSYSPAVDTSTFVITFPFTEKAQITVTKTLEATGVAVSPFAQSTSSTGGQYRVYLPVGTVNGYITTTIPVTAAYTILISRVTPLTQTTSFRTQGPYSADAHEKALDKLTFEIQETRAAAGTSGDTAVATHVAAADDHTQYFLLNGRSGGQTAYGGSVAGNNLTLRSDSDDDSGFIYIGNTVGSGILTIDDSSTYVGIMDPTPDFPLDVVGAIVGSTTMTVPTLYGSSAANGDLTIKPTSNGTVATSFIYMGSAGTELVLDDGNNRVGIGTAAPSTTLHVVGGSYLVGDVDIGMTGAPSIVVKESIDTVTITDLKATTDEVNTGFYVLTTATDGLYTAATGIGTYGPSHASLAGNLDLFGSTLNLRDDPDTAAHSTITDDLVAFDGQLKSQSYLVETTGTPTNMTTAECGVTYEATWAAAVIQLPNIGTEGTAAEDADAIGCKVTLINTFTSGTQPVSLSPHSSDSIFGSCVGITGAGAATIVEASGVVDKDWINTTATANKGDYTTVISNNPKAAAGIWYIVGCVGEWASAP